MKSHPVCSLWNVDSRSIHCQNDFAIICLLYMKLALKASSGSVSSACAQSVVKIFRYDSQSYWAFVKNADIREKFLWKIIMPQGPLLTSQYFVCKKNSLNVAQSKYLAWEINKFNCFNWNYITISDCYICKENSVCWSKGYFKRKIYNCCGTFFHCNKKKIAKLSFFRQCHLCNGTRNLIPKE